MDGQHVADADHARLRAGQLAELLDQLRVGGLADQQALRFIGEQRWRSRRG